MPAMRNALICLAVLTASLPAAAQERCALSLFHFNLQYCAGGLDGMAEDLGLDSGDYDWSEEAIEDAIIVESFVPLLDLLELHEDWTLTLEMQGYMVEVMAERHPDVLAQLHTLAHGGQAELVSFHYSDQLFLAHAAEDMERSVALTKAVFAEHDLPLSGAVFTQEGQFGEGMLPMMADHGYSVMLLPKNLFKVQHTDMQSEAFFDGGDVDVLVTSRGFEHAESGSGVTWTFCDDGELLATNDMPPYAGPLFVHNEASVAEYEAELEDRVADGYRISGIVECVEGLRAEGMEPPALPPVLDGAWQPEDTDNLGLWMGGAGIFGGDEGTEQDNVVLTTGTTSHLVLHAVQALADTHGQPEALDEAWRELLLGQVSDSTGWNPYRTETEYSVIHLATATELATAVAADLLELAPEQTVWLDGDGQVIDAPGEGTACAADFPIELATDGFGRTVDQTCTDDPVTGLPRLQICFGAAEATDAPEVVAAWDGEAYRLVPALTDAVVEVDADDITLEAIGLPGSLGVVGLTPDRWLVLDHQTVHLAARFDRGLGQVRIVDETLRVDQEACWRFHAANTAAEAVAAGQFLNTAGPIELTAAEAVGDDDDGAAPGDDDDSAGPGDDEGGCGCRAAGPQRAGVVTLALLTGLAWVRGRWR
jgi:hypothetical protein